MATLAELAAALDKDIANKALFDGIINGPVSGVGSIVEVGNDPENPIEVKTVARAISDIANAGDAAIAEFNEAAEEALEELASSGGVPWQISGCVGAYDDEHVVLNGGGTRVLTLTDLTGNGKDATHADDSNAAVPTVLGGIWPKASAYDIGGGGITGINTQAMTVVWVGREFYSEDPNSGQTGTGGYLYSITGAGRPGLGWGGAYTINQGPSAGELYAPGPIFAPAGRFSIVGQACGTARTTYFANGSVNTKNAQTGSTGNTISKLFSLADGTQGMYRITKAVLFFNRELTVREMAQIGDYYNCPTVPGGRMVYAYGSSTPNGQGAGETRLGVIQSFCDWIGASRCIHSIGGTSWNSYTDALATAGVLNVHRGFENWHVFMAQSNDMANNVSAATCLTKVTDGITRIKATDPFARFLLCPATPRNASFTGISAANFEIQRLAYNAGLYAIAAAQANVVMADAMSIAGMRNATDAGNGTLMDVDNIHLTASGHNAYAQSLGRAFFALPAENVDIQLADLRSQVLTWQLDTANIYTASGGVGGGAAQGSPGQLVVDSGTTSGGVALARLAGTNDASFKWVKRGDHPGRANFAWRHRLWMKFYVFGGAIAGTGWGQFWSTDAIGTTNVGLPDKRGFGFRITSVAGTIKITLMVHDGTTLTQHATPFTINTSVISEIELDMYQGVLYAYLDGVMVASLSGGPTVVNTSSNQSTPTITAYADTGGANTARWIVLDVRSLTTDS